MKFKEKLFTLYGISFRKNTSFAILFSLAFSRLDDRLLKFVSQITLKIEPVAFSSWILPVTSRSPFTCILNFNFQFNLEVNKTYVAYFQGMVYFS
jgi:hypothetical protein